jgi:hypothetical protein
VGDVDGSRSWAREIRMEVKDSSYRWVPLVGRKKGKRGAAGWGAGFHWAGSVAQAWPSWAA